MSNPSTPEDLLKQIADIQHLEKGKLCVLRQGPNGAYYNLQRWENGRNVSQYVPADQIATLRENLEAHAHFEALIEQYVQILSERTRTQRLAGVKKKTPAPQFALAQEAEIQQLMTQFAAQPPGGEAVQQLEVLLRTALFKTASELAKRQASGLNF